MAAALWMPDTAWRTSAGRQPEWRVVAQDSVTEERQVFASLDEFFAFLEERTRAPALETPEFLKS